VTALTARNVALTDQICAALDDEWPLPVSTLALNAKLGHAGYQNHADVLRILNRLAKAGEVEKIRLEDMRSCYWRKWPE
jgi:hypothetical protein